jgi:predicted NBD/HSP70 family sugar kinase
MRKDLGMSVIQRHRPRESKLIANKHRILNRIFREGRCSRFYLARRLNINASTIGNYVEEFLQQGILLENHARPTRRGRSPVPVWLNPDYGRFLGIDFEALRVRTVLTDFAGGIVTQKEVALRAGLGRDAVLKIVRDTAKETARQVGNLRLFAVGVAAPGLLDSAGGRIVRYSLLPDFQDVPLLEILGPHFDCPLYVEENIRALTLAEMLRGAGRGLRNFLCVAARSGIGMGIVIDGQIYTGNGGLAGKLGRLVLRREDQTQTLTQLVSAKGIVGKALAVLKSSRKTPLRRSLLQKGDDLSLGDLVAAMEAGDRPIRALFEQVGEDLGLVVANLANLFAPEKIVVAGEVPSCSAVVRERLQQGFRQHTLDEILRKTTLAEGALSGFAGAMGAAYLGFLKTYPPEEVVPAETVNSLMVALG